MAVALTPIWAEPRRGGRAEYVALIVACYVLAFTTFENLGTLGESGRAVPEEVRFDAIAAIKACARVGAAALVAWVLARRAGGARFGAVLGRLWPLVLFAVWGAFTALWSPMPALTLGHALEFLLLLLIAVAAALVCDRPGRSERLLFHICLIQVAYLALLVILALADPASARLVRVRLETEQILFAAEAETTFVKNPAEIACIASLAVILALAARLVWGWRWTRALLWPALGLGGGLLVVTQSRAPIGVTLALGGLTFVCWGGRRRLAAGGVLLCLLCLGYVALDPGLDHAAAVTDKVAFYMSRGQSSEELRGLGGRMSHWTEVGDSLKEHPEAVFIGYGYSMATPTGKLWNDGAYLRYTGHNIILDVLAGTGLVGLFFFIWGFFRLFLMALGRMARRKPGLESALPRQRGPNVERKVGFLALLALLYAFLSGVFGDSIVGPMDPTSVGVFVVLGLGLLSEVPARWNET